MTQFNWNQNGQTPFPPGQPMAGQPQQAPQPGYAPHAQPAPAQAPQGYGPPQGGFGGPPPQQTPQGYGLPQGGFGGPPPQQAPEAPLTADEIARRMAGFGAGALDVRDPFLPYGSVLLCEVVSTEAKNTRSIGFAIYIRVKCVAINDPGGHPCPPPVPKSINMAPATVGSIYCARISGFGDSDKEHFARTDLGMFIIAALADQGIDRVKYEALPVETKDGLGIAVGQGDARFVGKKIVAHTTKADNKDGNRALIKTAFHPYRG